MYERRGKKDLLESVETEEWTKERSRTKSGQEELLGKRQG